LPRSDEREPGEQTNAGQVPDEITPIEAPPAASTPRHLDRRPQDLRGGFGIGCLVSYAGKRCIVFTHSQPTSRHGEEFYSGEPELLVARLVRDRARRAYVDGGTIIQQFIPAGLISDMTISIVPILLGEGVRLFGKIGRDVRLKLLATRAFKSELVQIRYAVA
jgi:dihydrofolate reductase